MLYPHNDALLKIDATSPQLFAKGNEAVVSK